jgi:Domain of unknown function (DUF6602)
MPQKRTSGPAADVLQKLMKSQQDALTKAFDDATLYTNPGIRGEKREDGVRKFLADQLPQSLSVVTGQAIDYFGTVSRQLDIMVYDATLNAPFEGERIKLLPAEALLAIVEVKSTLSSAEWPKIAQSVAQYLELRPYRRQFAVRRGGQKAVADDLPRCFYSVVAFSSDLAKSSGWQQREFARMTTAFESEECLGLDRVLILDRGVINPSEGRHRSSDDFGSNLFTWYISMANFLNREAPRRKPMDWQQYAGASFETSWRRIVPRASRVSGTVRHQRTPRRRPNR